MPGAYSLMMGCMGMLFSDEDLVKLSQSVPDSQV